MSLASVTTAKLAVVGVGAAAVISVAVFALWRWYSSKRSDAACSYGCTDSAMVALMTAAEVNTRDTVQSFRDLVAATKKCKGGSDDTTGATHILEACAFGRERCLAVLEQLSGIAGPTVTPEMRAARKRLVACLMKLMDEGGGVWILDAKWSFASVEAAVSPAR